MKIACPKCGHKLRVAPTEKELEAYIALYIDGLSTEATATKLGVSRQTIHARMVSLRGLRPILFRNHENDFDLTKMVNFNNIDESKIIHKF